MRQRTTIGLACSFALFACATVAVRAQQPAPSPTPATASSPVTVVQAFFDAINRQDQNAAPALFAENGVYEGLVFCLAPNPCHDHSEIAAAIYGAWIIYDPITVDLEQVNPMTVIARGQGDVNRRVDTFFQVTFRVTGEQIASYHADDQNVYCGDAPRKSICPSFNPPPSTIYTPGRVLPSVTPTVAVSSAPAVGATAAAATAPQTTQPPAEQRGPSPVRASGTAGRLLLAVLALLGVAVACLVVAAVGVVVRRRSLRVSPP